MKNLYFAALLFFPFAISAQNIHGIWSGTLVNDSTHRTQEFELGLSEYRGKITGYTYTTFITNDTFYCSVKRIKAERKDDKLIVEDDEMVWNNFPEKVSKGVKQITTFPLINDTTIDITKGKWNTNQTKRYYSIGGSAAVKKLKDDEESDLLAHLQEINVKTDLVSNNKQKKEEPAVANYAETKSKPQQINDQKTAENKNNDVAKNPVQQPVVTSPETNLAHQSTGLRVSSDNDNKKENAVSKPEVKNNQPQGTAANNKQLVNTSNPQRNNLSKNNEAVTTSRPLIETNKPEQKQQEFGQVAQKNDQPANKKEESKIDKQVSMSDPTVKQMEATKSSTELPAFVAGRKNETIQDIYFRNDSLVLSLYDNGIVDGDTVSVFVNGENIISRQMLKASAAKKTIYVPANSDTLQLVLFAENLGTIPPNTGLLTVRDGDDIYQVRFSADLQKNASIILRRRK